MFWPFTEDPLFEQKIIDFWSIFGPPKKSKLSSRVSTPHFWRGSQITGLSGKYCDFWTRIAKMAKTVKNRQKPDFSKNRPFFATFWPVLAKIDRKWQKSPKSSGFAPRIDSGGTPVLTTFLEGPGFNPLSPGCKYIKGPTHFWINYGPWIKHGTENDHLFGYTFGYRA